MNYLTSVISPNMFGKNSLLKQTEISIDEIPENFESLLKQEWLAKLVGKKLNKKIIANKQIVTLKPGDVLYIIQYFGPYIDVYATLWPLKVFDDNNFNCYKIEVIGKFI